MTGGIGGALALLVLAGCGGGATQVAPASEAPAASASGTPGALPAAEPTGAPSSPAGGAAAATGPGRYVDLATYRADPAAYSSGRVVLFFHATWCPNCRLTEKNLTQDPASIPADLTIVKVDFDTETDLRKQYGITQQHTFVAVGPDGAEKATWTGTHTAAEISDKAV